MLPILYSFRRCPYAIRTRYLILLLELPVALREVVLKAKPDALLRLGGRSTVPQLIDETGQRYPESLDIIFWALQQKVNNAISQQLWPEEVTLRHKTMSWVYYNDHFFKHWLDRYKYADRHPEQSEVFYRTQGERFLGRLEHRLGLSQFLQGERVGLADVCLFPFIRQFVGVDARWFEQADYPNLKRWLGGFIEGDVFQRVMTKYAPWHEGQEVVIFP